MSSKNGANKRYMERHFALGLCVHCPRPAKPGRRQCAMHLEKLAAISRRNYRNSCPERRRRYADRKELGCCTMCGAPLHGSRLCFDCRQKNQRWQLAYNLRRRVRATALGVCVDCQDPPRSGAVRCEKHLAANNASKRRYAAKANKPPREMCGECGQNEPMTGQAVCWCCAKQARKAQAA